MALIVSPIGLTAMRADLRRAAARRLEAVGAQRR